MYHVLYTLIMCDKMYDPKNDGVLVYGSTYYTVNAVAQKKFLPGKANRNGRSTASVVNLGYQN